MSFKTDRHLLEAIEQCHSTKLVHSIKVGQHIHVQNELGQNLLVHLLQQQYLEEDSLMNKKRFRIFRSLVVLGNLDIHTADHYGKNLFNWATHLNCTQEALFLLRTYPGDVDILKRDHAGSSSLHYAVEHGNDLLVRAISGYLLRYRLRFDVKDALNYTPEDLARKLNYTSIADFLAKSCRSTIYLSRETPAQQSTRPMSGNSKIATSTASPPIVDPFESFHLMETRITKAKHSGDWKTVAALRAFKIHSDPKNTLRLRRFFIVFWLSSHGWCLFQITILHNSNKKNHLSLHQRSFLQSSIAHPRPANPDRCSTYSNRKCPRHFVCHLPPSITDCSSCRLASHWEWMHNANYRKHHHVGSRLSQAIANAIPKSVRSVSLRFKTMATVCLYRPSSSHIDSQQWQRVDWEMSTSNNSKRKTR